MASWSHRSFSGWPACPFTHTNETSCGSFAASRRFHRSTFFTGCFCEFFQPRLSQPSIQWSLNAFTTYCESGMHGHLAGVLERFEADDDGQKLHAVVRRAFVALGQLALVQPPVLVRELQHAAVAARTGVAARGAVGVHGHMHARPPFASDSVDGTLALRAETPGALRPRAGPRPHEAQDAKRKPWYHRRTRTGRNPGGEAPKPIASPRRSRGEPPHTGPPGPKAAPGGRRGRRMASSRARPAGRRAHPRTGSASRSARRRLSSCRCAEATRPGGSPARRRLRPKARSSRP